MEGDGAQVIEEATVIAPAASAPLQEGKDALARGDRDEALSCLERAVSLQPENTEARLALANLLRAMGLLHEARAQFEAIIAHEPCHLAALTSATQIASALGDWTATLEYSNAALKANPGNLAMRVQNANALQRLNRLDEALAGYRTALTAEPTNAQAFAGIGHVAYKRGDSETAAEHFQRAIDLGATSETLLAALADSLFKLDRKEEATAIYARIGPPRDQGAARLLANVARRLGHDEEAVAHIEAAIGFDPDNPGLRLELAGLLHALNRTDEAVTAYEDILSRDNRNPQAALKLAAIAREHGDKEKALRYLELAAETDPGTGPQAFTLAEGLMAARRLDKAEAIYRRLLASGTDQPKARAGLAAIARLLGDLDQASDHLSAAATLATTVIAYRLDLAKVLCDLGRWNEAERTYFRILDRWPENADALVGLGEIAKVHGDHKAALAYFEGAAKMAPGNPMIRKKIRMLPDANRQYDWRSEIEEALTILRTDEASPRFQIEAAQTLVQHGLTQAALPALERLEEHVPRARQLIIAARQMERTGLAQAFQSGRGPAGDMEDQLDAITGYVERPVSGADTLLIVFAGTNDRAWIAFSLLHRILQSSGVSVVYARDLQRRWYRKGIVGLGDDFPSTVAAFRDMATRYGARRILTLGNCVGCRGALDYGLALCAEGVLGVSPKLRARDDLDVAQKIEISEIRRDLAPDHKNLRARYLDADVQPKVTFVYGQDYAPDIADVAFMADLPDVVAVGIPGSSDPDSVKDLLVRDLLAPILHDFVRNGTVSAEVLALISASVDP